MDVDKFHDFAAQMRVVAARLDEKSLPLVGGRKFDRLGKNSLDVA